MFARGKNTRTAITSRPSVFGVRALREIVQDSRRNARRLITTRLTVGAGIRTDAVAVITIDERTERTETNTRIRIYVNGRRCCATSHVDALDVIYTFITVPRGPKDNRCYYFITVYYTIFFPPNDRPG